MTPDFTCLLIPLAMAGLAILNAGLTRSRSTSHILLASLCAVSVAMLAFVIVGFSVAGNGRLFALSLDLTGIAGPLMLLMQLFSVGIAAGASRRFAHPRLCWPVSFIRCSRIGRQVQAGSERWALPMQAARAVFRFSEELVRCVSFGS